MHGTLLKANWSNPALLLLSLVLPSCSGCDDDSRASGGDIPMPQAVPAEKPWGDIDLEAELAHLDGRFKLELCIYPGVWEFDNGTVRPPPRDGQPAVWNMSMTTPGYVHLEAEGSSWAFWYSRHDDTMYVGPGPSITKIEGGYLVRSLHLVVYREDSCQLFPGRVLRPPEFDPPVDIQCRLETSGSKATLHYQEPAFGRPGELEEASLLFDPKTTIADGIDPCVLERID